jgi:glucokinase
MRVGVDVGASKVNFVSVDWNQKVVRSKRCVIVIKDKKYLTGLIVGGIRTIKGEKRLSGVGIALPGKVNYESGYLIKAPNLKFFEKVRIGRIVRENLNVYTKIENDTKAFSIAESKLGAARGLDNVIFLTLGSGIGGGLMINGELYKGEGVAGEIGHMIVDEDGRKCSCGSYGCLEEYASAKGYRVFVKEIMGKEINPRHLAKLAYKNKRARRVFTEMGRHLGVGLASAANLLDPELIVVGGGLSNVKWILTSAEQEMKKRLYTGKNLRIVKTRIGDDAPALGAALMV